jgi:hypothetical protein
LTSPAMKRVKRSHLSLNSVSDVAQLVLEPT